LSKYFDADAEKNTVINFAKPAVILENKDVANQISFRIKSAMVYVTLAGQLGDKGIESSVVSPINLASHEDFYSVLDVHFPTYKPKSTHKRPLKSPAFNRSKASLTPANGTDSTSTNC